MYITLIVLSNLVLAGISAVSFVKNFLIHFNVSDNGWKTGLVALLIVISLLCALTSYSEAFTLKDIKIILASPESPDEDVDILKQEIVRKTNNMIAALCIGYAACFLHFVLIKRIKATKMRHLESIIGTRWADRIS